MNKTEILLERLRCQQPEISNPDELTERIMESLPDVERNNRLSINILRAVRIVSSVAAAWFIGLFIFVSNPSTPQRQTNVEIHQKYGLSRGEMLRKTYAGLKQKSQTKQLSYIQLKKMYYENH